MFLLNYCLYNKSVQVLFRKRRSMDRLGLRSGLDRIIYFSSQNTHAIDTHKSPVPSETEFLHVLALRLGLE